MASKVALLNLGLLAIMVFISSKGEARPLPDTTKTKVVDSRCAQTESTDCFMIPGFGGIGGMPGFGGIPLLPGFGGTPLLPGGPKANVVMEKNDNGNLKDSKKSTDARCVESESTDCFNIPGLPNFGIPGFGGIPLFPGVPTKN
ncbi:leguminosin group485 secreted peptide [Trifolium pratense]|uniref:Uncharacterized protein n=2 Tax=Trifolium pratense TaxID=57577 RepID=A0ACB0J7E5_TRIPR|nr:elastin-like [Trifolium pratense]XP_045827125.1 elastin-like [Trifolium pratense]PNX95135.1 leguminosin group485 secreted peptide [Trifolium pratense]CAJ2639864.1 unnamed protein product [Trifolium pratense]